ncbi:hypothetical protein TNCV_4122851 [Trichonephila clavipes]|nr:hypothetical protein TNCV_4122851 [Trichonephila clavipes]
MSAVHRTIGGAKTCGFQSRVNKTMDALRTFKSAANGVECTHTHAPRSAGVRKKERQTETLYRDKVIPIEKNHSHQEVPYEEEMVKFLRGEQRWAMQLV